MFLLENCLRLPKLTFVPLAVLVSEHRLLLCYGFGLCCLLCWFAFNLWVLRDYFFPWWYPPIYTEQGLRKTKLDTMKRNYLVRVRMSDAFQLTASIGVGHFAKRIMANCEHQRLVKEGINHLTNKSQRHSIAVSMTNAWEFADNDRRKNHMGHSKPQESFQSANV